MRITSLSLSIPVILNMSLVSTIPSIGIGAVVLTGESVKTYQYLNLATANFDYYNQFTHLSDCGTMFSEISPVFGSEHYSKYTSMCAAGRECKRPRFRQGEILSGQRQNINIALEYLGVQRVAPPIPVLLYSTESTSGCSVL